MAGAGEMIYIGGRAPPKTVRVPVPCEQEVAVGEPIPSCVELGVPRAILPPDPMIIGPKRSVSRAKNGESRLFRLAAA